MRSRLWCVLLSVALVFVFSGCAEKQVKTAGMDKQSAAGEGSSAPEKMGAAKAGAESGAMAAGAEKAGATKKAGKKAVKGTTYVVKKGDCLWFIAGFKDIYGDSFLWPVIYNANKKKIKNPNLIYPGQKLLIPREGVSMDAVKKARKKAGAPKPYTPPANAKPPVS